MALPRFNYTVASSRPSLHGFLITCSLDREKSATKEAISILKQYLKGAREFNNFIGSASSDLSGSAQQEERAGEDYGQEGKCVKEEQTDSHDTHGSSIEKGTVQHLPLEARVQEAKKQTTANGVRENVHVRPVEAGNIESYKATSPTTDIPALFEGEVTTNDVKVQGGGEEELRNTNSFVTEKNSIKEDQKQKSGGAAVNLKRSHANLVDICDDDWSCFFLLKMAQKGIISIFLDNRFSDDPVQVLAELLEDIENGARNPPQWCQRIVPVQASCTLSKDGLSTVVVRLVKQHLGETAPTEEQPLKFAIGYNRRGFETREMGKSKSLCEPEMLGRMDCIHLIAETIAKVVPHTIVDLGAPQMVVLVEVIPLAGVQGSPVCGVSVVSREMVSVKPKLCIKPLISASHPSKRNKK